MTLTIRQCTNQSDAMYAFVVYIDMFSGTVRTPFYSCSGWGPYTYKRHDKRLHFWSGNPATFKVEKMTW